VPRAREWVVLGPSVLRCLDGMYQSQTITPEPHPVPSLMGRCLGYIGTGSHAAARRCGKHFCPPTGAGGTAVKIVCPNPQAARTTPSTLATTNRIGHSKFGNRPPIRMHCAAAAVGGVGGRRLLISRCLRNPPSPEADLPTPMVAGNLHRCEINFPAEAIIAGNRSGRTISKLRAFWPPRSTRQSPVLDDIGP